MDEDLISAEEQRKLLKLLSALLKGGNSARAFEADSEDNEPLSEDGCFAPGTKILTSNGEINIEDVQEDAQILTEVGDSPDNVLFYGFNHEQPFFSASNVFQTTTGRRAVDPETALQENLFLEDNIGRLNAGHVLFHTTMAKCAPIRAIHLKKGLRSYHANGFLMHLNYPEITNESVVKMIGILPRKQQSDVLSRFPKLRPLMESGTHSLRNPRAFEPDLESQFEMSMTQQHLNRCWKISCQDSGGLDDAGYTLEVREGEVFIDDESCDIARVDQTMISWERYLEGSGWEHGMLEMNCEHMVGEGVIYRGSENQNEPGPESYRISATLLRRADPRIHEEVYGHQRLQGTPSEFLINIGP
ncbi:hypothetical protein QQX98_010605 [Neonectria punicea]|uniref:Uncharacterized protein n=1 Tax=Neonectria punicea TaxID=979145 RepID=A0ABR1GPG8_9HYPO